MVAVIAKQDKHTAEDMYLVTGTEDDRIQMQKILHPLSPHKKIMSKVYKTDAKRLIVINSPQHLPDVQPIPEKPPLPAAYNPISPKYWSQTEYDNSMDDGDPADSAPGDEQAADEPLLPGPVQADPLLVDEAELAAPVGDIAAIDLIQFPPDPDPVILAGLFGGIQATGAVAVSVDDILLVDDAGDEADDEDEEDEGDHQQGTDLEDEEDEADPNHLDQSCQPRKGDIINYCTDMTADTWAKAKLLPPKLASSTITMSSSWILVSHWVFNCFQPKPLTQDGNRPGP